MSSYLFARIFAALALLALAALVALLLIGSSRWYVGFAALEFIAALELSHWFAADTRKVALRHRARRIAIARQKALL